MEAFENLDVWNRSHQLAVEIYKSLHNCREFALKDQIIRSVISVPSNIAEGFERNSNKQFIQFLRIAKGSCGELRSQLYLCASIGLLSEEKTMQFQQEAKEISKMIQGLIRYCMSKLK